MTPPAPTPTQACPLGLPELLNIPAAEDERRKKHAHHLLAWKSIDKATLTPEQFEVFANQAPEWQAASLNLFTSYGAERCNIVHPDERLGNVPSKKRRRLSDPVDDKKDPHYEVAVDVNDTGSSPNDPNNRKEVARQLLAAEGIDLATLTAEQFDVFAEQAPDLQDLSLFMLSRYGAKRLRVFRPDGSQEEDSCNKKGDGKENVKGSSGGCGEEQHGDDEGDGKSSFKLENEDQIGLSKNIDYEPPTEAERDRGRDITIQLMREGGSPRANEATEQTGLATLDVSTKNISNTLPGAQAAFSGRLGCDAERRNGVDPGGITEPCRDKHNGDDDEDDGCGKRGETEIEAQNNNGDEGRGETDPVQEDEDDGDIALHGDDLEDLEQEYLTYQLTYQLFEGSNPLGLLNGRYELCILCSGVPTPSAYLIVALAGDQLWGKFCMPPFVEGVLRMPQRPRQVSYDPVRFAWRGRDLSAGFLGSGMLRESRGSLVFFGRGRVDARFDTGERFEAKRIFNQGTRPEISSWAMERLWHGEYARRA